MDDLQFRRNLYADPKTTDPEMLSAKNADPAKQKFSQELDALDQKIFKAMSIDVPEGLSDKLILKQTMASHQKQKKTSRIKLALAASVTFAIGLTFNQLQYSHAYGSVGDYAIAHTKHEAENFNNDTEANISLTSLNQKMASFNGSFADELGELMMADYCRFDGMKSLHLVFKGESSPVNVFIVPANEHLAFNNKFSAENLNGVASNFNENHIIVVGDNNEPVQLWQERIRKNVRWSA